MMAVASLRAAEPPAAPRVPASDPSLLPPEGVKKALEMLTSPNASIRERASNSLRQRSKNEAAKKQAIEIYLKAQAVQKASIEALVKRGVPALSRVQTQFDEWNTKRTAVLALIRSDYKKDAAKIAMLNGEHADTAKLRNAVDKELGAAAAAFKALADATFPLEHLDRERTLLEDSTRNYTPKAPETYLKGIGVAQSLLATMALVTQRQQAIADEAAVEKHNQSSKWAPKSAIVFAKILNENRCIMGLHPLRLDEKLSTAATSHSKEMAAKNYFAHESPVAANKTPPDRARNAKFDGACAGENIFMGSDGPQAAYSAWWASDGHRFIMFGDGPNTLGAGPSGVHWTMMTGKKQWK